MTDPREDHDHDTGAVTDPEDRGAPVAESHYLVSEHDGNTRIDIADDATARPGPGPGQPEAEGEA
jgi:hypothetical protein